MTGTKTIAELREDAAFKILSMLLESSLIEIKLNECQQMYELSQYELLAFKMFKLNGTLDNMTYVNAYLNAIRETLSAADTEEQVQEYLLNAKALTEAINATFAAENTEQTDIGYMQSTKELIDLVVETMTNHKQHNAQIDLSDMGTMYTLFTTNALYRLPRFSKIVAQFE